MAAQVRWKLLRNVAGLRTNVSPHDLPLSSVTSSRSFTGFGPPEYRTTVYNAVFRERSRNLPYDFQVSWLSVWLCLNNLNMVVLFLDPRIRRSK